MPKQILVVEGTRGLATEDYCAKEFHLVKGEVLISIRELNGWIWGFKERNKQNSHGHL